MLPPAASLVVSFLLFGVLLAVAARRALSGFGRRYLSFLGVFWMTAPLAWIYAIPFERFLDATVRGDDPDPLVRDALSVFADADDPVGGAEALETLIRRHQSWIYNTVQRMVYLPQDAEDITQEILIKVLTKLSTFEGRSSFRTWLYRIVVNHVLNMKRTRIEELEWSFERYGAGLDGVPDFAGAGIPADELLRRANAALRAASPGEGTWLRRFAPAPRDPFRLWRQRSASSRPAFRLVPSSRH